MLNFKEEWDLLFTQMLCSIYTLDNNRVSVTETDRIYLNKTKLLSGSRTIISDILLFYSNLDSTLIYFEYICKVFLKYQFSFISDKCDFLKTQFKYVALDVTEAGTFPVQLKFYLINDCIVTPTGQ